MLDCLFCKEKECVSIIVETYTETCPEIIIDENTYGFDLTDAETDNLWQDIKFECEECMETFRYFDSLCTDAFNQIEYFDDDVVKAFQKGDKFKFILINRGF